ncbi:MAG: thioredoxin family protein [Acidobacteriaceae bacterium]
MPLHSIGFARSFQCAALACFLASAPLAARADAPNGGDSASDILHRAEDQARAEHKKILLEFGASWCVNCRLYDRFLGDPQMHALMSRAFVFVTVDTGESPRDKKHANTPGGVAFEGSVGGKDAGWPFLVILNAGGRPVVDSNRPDPKSRTGKSNIGYPVAPEEIDWFVEMLHRGAPSLSSDDRSQVRTWLAAFAAKQHH